LTGASSNSFTVTGPAAKLAFTQQPGPASTGVFFATQPTVAVEDSTGLVVTDDNTTSITLSLVGIGTLTCGGGLLSATAVNGVATFSGCSIDAVGTDTIHAASNPALTAADTSPFAVAASSGTVWYFAEGFTGNN
jgi:hypothetical protein